MEIHEELEKIKKEHYFNINSNDDSVSNCHNKIKVLKMDMSELTKQLYNLRNFYNKRMNVVYKDIYDLKHNLGEDIQA
jgi:hypothetical protein